MHTGYESTPLQGQSLGGHFEQLSTFKGICVAASGTFADLPEDENDEWPGPTKDLYVGVRLLRPQSLTTHGDRLGEEEKSEDLEYLGYLRTY